MPPKFGLRMNWKKQQRSNLSDMDPSNIGSSLNRQSSRDILNIYNWVWLWVWLGHAVVFLTNLSQTYPTYGSQGARIREVRMYYEFISLGCGKCNTTPLHCFPTKHNYVYRLLIIYYTKLATTKIVKSQLTECLLFHTH